jgi:hypothetical protein
MHEKLKGLPKIIYLNSKHHSERDDEMKSQFDILGIENYERYEKEYTNKNIEEDLGLHDWLKFIEDDFTALSVEELSITLDHYNAIVKWLDTSDDDVCIIMDDVVNMDTIEYWHFDWEKFYYRLPYNWDCIQLFVNSTNEQIRTYLHPWRKTSRSTRCYMITRQFAKKVKKFHYKDGKFRLYYPNKDRSHYEPDEGSVEVTLFDLGITYSCPLFRLTDMFMESDELDIRMCRDRLSSQAIQYFWNYAISVQSNEEFFNYGYSQDWKRIVTFDMKSEWVHQNKEKMLVWI